MSLHRYDSILELLGERRPACGATTVVAVDGPSGAGKTGFAAGLAARTDGSVLHLEDLYPGWGGLAATPPLVAGILDAIAIGEIGRAASWDWDLGAPGASVQVPPADLLILDGVGSGAEIIRPHLSLLIWVDAPVTVRKARALARDGEMYAPFWDMWAEQETHHFAAQQTRQHADLIITTGSDGICRG